MAPRVVLNSSGLRISKPGIDVLSATAVQLQFSSDWTGMGLVQQGTYNVNSYSGNRHAGSINLVKTFASPPFCIFMLAGPGYYSVFGYGTGAVFNLNRGDGPNGTDDGSRTCLVAQVGTSSINITAMYSLASGGVPVPTYSIRYYVFDNNQ